MDCSFHLVYIASKLGQLKIRFFVFMDRVQPFWFPVQTVWTSWYIIAFDRIS